MDFVRVIGDALRAALGLEAAVYALAAIGLNVHFGYTGLLNFGQVGFMLVGAYGLAITVSTFGGSMWLGMLVGVLLAVVLAILLGGPTLRLRADYLAITTIAAAEILRFTFRSSPATGVTGGVFGLQRFADAFYEINPLPQGTYGFWVVQFSHRRMWVMLVAWGLVALSCLMVWALMHSPWGRVLKSIREDEEAARSLGKNVFSFKMQGLILGGVFGALSGIFLAIGQQAVSPDTYIPQITFFTYTVLILGGAARVFGPVLGSVLFWLLIAGTDSFIRRAASAGMLPEVFFGSDTIGAVRFMLVGAGLMILMIYRPEGILGDRREMQLDV
ncbi:MAG TPA: branched-chain amino acid ABC transporter permease [Egibacteraceae bacterium]|nr:branched-chain amino acid ABC transporter permease [Egibacteraceae bacterium]